MKNLQWRIHTPNLFNDIIKNMKGNKMSPIPFSIFKNLLAQVAERASELNDEKLNQLMMRMTLYDISDPESENYDKDFVNKYLS